MNISEAELGPLLFIGSGGDAGEAMIITEDRHECGWSERITYSDRDGEIIRSGCAGCEAERPVLKSQDHPAPRTDVEDER